MSIVRIPALLHCQTVQDWMITLQKQSIILSPNCPKPMNPFCQNAIIYFSLQGITPFSTCCVLFKGEPHLLYGQVHLMTLYRFVMQNKPVQLKEWHFPQLLPASSGDIVFSDLTGNDQKTVLSTRIINNDFRVETYAEFETLRRFCHETDMLISSPI